MPNQIECVGGPLDDFSVWQFRGYVVGFLQQEQPGFLSPSDLREKIEKSMDCKMHPMKFHRLMRELEQDGVVEYWHATIHAKGETMLRNYYRLVGTYC